MFDIKMLYKGIRYEMLEEPNESLSISKKRKLWFVIR